MSDQPPVRLDVDADGIATLTLNRPEQLNAFDLPMIEAWRAALEAADVGVMQFGQLPQVGLRQVLLLA